MNYLLDIVILHWSATPMGMEIEVCSHIWLICEYFLRSSIYQTSKYSNPCYIHPSFTNAWDPTTNLPLWWLLQTLWPYHPKWGWEDGAEVPMVAAGTDMFTLHWHFRVDGVTCMSDVIPLTSVHKIMQLILVFGANMDMRLNSNTFLDHAHEFHLNNFANKNTFHALLTYQ